MKLKEEMNTRIIRNTAIWLALAVFAITACQKDDSEVQQQEPVYQNKFGFDWKGQFFYDTLDSNLRDVFLYGIKNRVHEMKIRKLLLIRPLFLKNALK